MKIEQNSNRIPIKESIMIDLKYELDNVDFASSIEETKSYHFIVSKLEERQNYVDGSITDEQLILLINFLHESKTPLNECYFNMINMIETGRYLDAVG